MQLYLAFVAIGVASAMVLYEAAFAVLVAVLDPRRRRSAVLAVTIVAGFASSIFIPLTGALDAHYGWRTTVLILAAVQAGTIPLHAATLRGIRPAGHHERAAAASRPPRAGRRRVPRDTGFWLLAAAFDDGRHYATIAAAVATPAIIAKATAPMGAAALIASTGYTPVLIAIATLCLAAAGCLTLSNRTDPARRAGP